MEDESLGQTLARWIAGRGARVVGLCGPQGAGKSTLATAMAAGLRAEGMRVAVFSLDDLYLTRAARAAMAETVHPLFAIRGPPGTHDVALGLRVLDALAGEGVVRLPRFDKAADDRTPPQRWDEVAAPVDVVLFEGWCVGVRPQDDDALVAPVNAMEREDDAEGVWRRRVNAALAREYPPLWARLDALIVLQAPDFGTVVRWRQEQEHALAARLAREGSAGRAMDDAEVAAFCQLYERLTRHIARETPARADAVITLDGVRRVADLRLR